MDNFMLPSLNMGSGGGGSLSRQGNLMSKCSQDSDRSASLGMTAQLIGSESKRFNRVNLASKSRNDQESNDMYYNMQHPTKKNQSSMPHLV